MTPEQSRGRHRRREPLRAAPTEVDLTSTVDLTAAPAPPPPPSSEDERPRALIVDDEVDIRDWLRVELRAQGWMVNCARSVAEGTEMALRLRPHLVLLDQRLPDGHGLTMARQLQQDAPAIHVVLFSAYLDLAAEEEAAALGVQTISKVDRTALFATVAVHHRMARATSS